MIQLCVAYINICALSDSNSGVRTRLKLTSDLDSILLHAKTPKICTLQAYCKLVLG
jgi:hypothetical protein